MGQKRKTQTFVVVFLLMLLGLGLLGNFVPRVEATITPIIVDTPVIQTSSANTAQQHILNLTGRTWIFYGDGTNFVYKSSLDRVTWTSQTTFHAGGATAGGLFSVVDNSTHIFYSLDAGAAGDNVYFNVGTPSGSTISWIGEIQIVDIPAGDFGHFGNIALDIDGNPWITWTQSIPTWGLPYVTKLERSGGSWQNASGFPYLLTTDNTRVWRGSLTALNDGTVYVIYNSISAGMKGKLWNGTAWSGEEAVSGSELPSNYNVFSVRATSDVVHVTYSKATSYDIQYRKRESGSWSTITTIKASQSSNSLPFLTTYGDSLFTFWQNNKAMYYSIYTDNSWHYMGQFYSGSVSISASSPTAVYPISGDSFPIAWQDATGSPYEIRLLDFRLSKPSSNLFIVSEGSKLSSVTLVGEVLRFTVTAASAAISSTKVYCGDGRPNAITPQQADGDWDGVNRIQTVTWMHASSQEIQLSWEIASAGKYVLDVYVQRDFLPALGTVNINGENQSTNLLGQTSWQLPYGTYQITAYQGTEKQSVTLLLNGDTSKTFNFITPPPKLPKFNPLNLLAIPLIAIAIATAYLTLFRRRK
jgi:hypothetical protein